MISPTYLRSLVDILRLEPNPSLSQTDFLSPEGYWSWQDQVGLSMQSVLISLLEYRFGDSWTRDKLNRERVKSESQPRSTVVRIFFRLVKGRGFRERDFKGNHVQRSPIVSINFAGNKWRTDVVQVGDGNEFIFNQHLNL